VNTVANVRAGLVSDFQEAFAAFAALGSAGIPDANRRRADWQAIIIGIIGADRTIEADRG